MVFAFSFTAYTLIWNKNVLVDFGETFYIQFIFPILINIPMSVKESKVPLIF